jgi:hypothetical protein
MIADQHLTVAEAEEWCAGALGHHELGRLRQLTGQAHDKNTRITAPPPCVADDSVASMREALSAITADHSQRAS